jgi:hypothetical protein
MHSFDAILDCLCLGRSAHYDVLEEQPALGFPHEKAQQSTQSLAEDVLSILYAADINDEHFRQRIQDVVRETGWYESLAVLVLHGLENALKAGAPMGQKIKNAYEEAAKVVGDVWGFVKEHPVFFTLVALGILVILLPWAIELLGFGELGPIEGTSVVVYLQGDALMLCLLVGTFAARWQSTYKGYVHKDSLSSFFQRLGMKWARILGSNCERVPVYIA